MRKVASLIVVMILIGLPAFAGVQANSGQGTASQTETGTSYNKSINKQKSISNTETKNRSKGIEKSLSKTLQKAKNLSNQTNIQTTVNPFAIVSPVIAKFEKQNIGIFGKCKLITKPPTEQKIYNTEVAPGVYDTNAQEYYNAVERQQGTIKCKNCVRMAMCCLEYGTVIKKTLSETEITLLELIKNRIIKTKNTKRGIEIEGISLEDLRKIFEINLIKNLKHELNYPELNNTFVRLTQGGFFVYSDSGAVKYTLPNSCTYNNVTWLSTHTIAGINFVINITKGWGYSMAWNAIRQNRKFAQQTKNKQKTLQYLYSKGMAKQYFTNLKKSVHETLQNQADFNPEKTP